MIMRLIGPIISRLGISRFRDWYRFAWARLRSAGTIEAASLPYIDPPFKLRLAKGSRMVLGRDVRFGTGFGAYVEDGVTVEIGDRVLFTANAWVGAAASGVRIGTDSAVGPGTIILDANHRFGQPGVPFMDQGIESHFVDIGENVWMGSNATIMNNIGSDSVIGANSVVNKPIPARCLAVGAPARVVRHFDAVAADDAETE